MLCTQMKPGSVLITVKVASGRTKARDRQKEYLQVAGGKDLFYFTQVQLDMDLSLTVTMYLKVKTNGDYHEDMDGKTFIAWFQNQLLPTLEELSVIVLDNASYHNLWVPETIAPTSNFRKQVMIDWLQEKGIHVGPLMLKPEIYKVVKKFRSGP